VEIGEVEGEFVVLLVEGVVERLVKLIVEKWDEN
jgi:hypothetical protein